MSTNKLCPQCKGTGSMPQMKKEIIAELAPGSTPEITKYTCAFCGYMCAEIDSGGEEWDSANMNSFIASTGLSSSLVNVGRANTSAEQDAGQPPR